MPEFTSNTLVLIDNNDRENASDGHSRYGAYLAHNAGQLHDDGQPLNAAEFACAAWRIATSPVMSPGYARIRPDLHNLTPVISDNYQLQLRIDLPMRHSSLTHRPRQDSGFRALPVDDWTPDLWDRSDDQWKRLFEPEPTGRPALLVTATLLVPVPEHILITPATARPGTTLTRDAKCAVRALAEHANDHAHLVADLTGGGR